MMCLDGSVFCVWKYLAHSSGLNRSRRQAVSAFCGVGHQVFEFGADLFDWAKVWTVGRLVLAVDAVF